MPISRPLPILVAATVALMAIWVLGLRPKPVAVQDTPLAATQQIAKAKAAAAASDAANARVQAATGGAAAPAAATAPDGAASAAPKAAAPAQPVKRDNRDAAVVRDLKAGKVVVLLFWDPEGAEDIAARGALRDLDLRGGKVVVRVAPIARAAQYESVAGGVRIARSPTTLVIGRKGTTRAIVGLGATREISQAVGEALAGR